MKPTPASLDAGERVDVAQLKRSSVRGGAVTAATQAINFAIHLASTVTLARILSPEDYGVVAMVTTITVFAGLFRDLGLSASTIQRKTLTHHQLSNLFWINVAAGATLTIITASAAPLVAWFYGRPELTPVTLALSLTFVIGSFSTQQSALLTRRMLFLRRSVATVSGALVTLIVAVTLALNGMRYWALVSGTLAGAVITTLLLNTFSGWRPSRPSRGTGIRSMMKYGLNLTGFDLVNYFSRNLDNVLIGRYCGPDALGLYSRAYNLMMLPISNLRGPIGAVAFPAMSRLQGQPDDFRSYYRTVTFVLGVTSMPLVALLFIVSEPLIELALGPQWLPSARIFSVLAIAAYFQTASGFRGTALMSLGMGQQFLAQGVIGAFFASLSFVIGVRWGPMGVATAYAIQTWLLLYPTHVYAFHGTPITVRDFFGPLVAPMFASIAAGLAAWLLRAQMLGGTSLWVDLGATSVIYSIIYLALLLIRSEDRSRLQRAIRFLRRREPTPAKVTPTGLASTTPSSPSSAC